MQTWQMTCVTCGELRWPYLSEKPSEYECMRCKSGVGAGKRESGRRGGTITQARRRHQQSPDGSAHITNKGE